MSAVGSGLGEAGRQPVHGPELRPLNVGETMSAAIELYRSNAVALWTVVAMVIVPIEIIDVVVRRVTLPSDVFLYHSTLYTHQIGTTSSGAATTALIAVAVLSLLAQLLATGAVFKLQLDAYLGRPHDPASSFAFARHRVGSLLWLGVLSTIVIVIGFILLVLPGIYLLVALSVSIPVLMLEGRKGTGAMRRSMSLVRGHWWASFARLLIAVIMYIVVLYLLGRLAAAVTHSMTNVTVFLIIVGVFNAIGAILLSPFIAAILNVLYVDLRVRKEELTADMLHTHLGSAEQGATPVGERPLSSGGGPEAPVTPPS